MINITDFNYCPKCGEELVESAEFCHSCGFSLSEVGSNSQSRDESGENRSTNPFQYIDETTMESLDFDPYSPTDGEAMEKFREEIGKVVEEYELTIDEVDADDMFHYIIIDKIFERSARIFLDEADKQSMDIHTLHEQMENED